MAGFVYAYTFVHAFYGCCVLCYRWLSGYVCLELVWKVCGTG